MTGVKRLLQAEIAVTLGISVRQLQRLEAAGLPSIPVGKRAKRYDLAACEQWLAANRDALCRSDKTPPAVGTSSSALVGGTGFEPVTPAV